MSLLMKNINVSLLIVLTLSSSQVQAATAIGADACLSEGDSGENNSCFGQNSGTENTSGDNNTNVGFNAGNANTTSNNTFVGSSSGELNTNGTDNTFLGTRSGAVNLTGTDNTLIGTDAGAANTTTDNTFVGAEAGKSNTTGADNTFIGEESGEYNTIGSDNTFVGENAGALNSTGDNNTFIGSQAGAGYSSYQESYLLTGHNNTAVGEEAGYNLKESASRNTLIGTGAGTDIGTGLANTMIGSEAGSNTEYADFNTFVGALAGWDNNRSNATNSGNRNTALGALAGYVNRNGDDNIWIGAFAHTQSSTYAYDSALETDMEAVDTGTSLGITATLPGGNDEIFRTTVLGAFSGANDDDSISLGYGAISDQSNSVTIGSNASGTGRYDTTIGDSASNTGSYSSTLGYQAATTHTQAVSIGYQATSHADKAVVMGNADTVNWDPAVDGVTALGKGKSCYYDGVDPDGEWLCESMFRFKEIAGKNLSALGEEAGMAEINVWADEGDDHADQWSLSATDNGVFSIASYVNSTYSSSESNYETRVKTDLFTVENNGDVTVAGGLTLNSDKRLKKEIKAIDNAMDKINKIDGVTYQWKEGLGRSKVKQYGVIAQNIETVIPELVKDDDKGVKSVNYQALIPVLINATQEKQKQLDTQKQQIALQQKQIDFLFNQLASM